MHERGAAEPTMGVEDNISVPTKQTDGSTKPQLQTRLSRRSTRTSLSRNSSTASMKRNESVASQVTAEMIRQNSVRSTNYRQNSTRSSMSRHGSNGAATLARHPSFIELSTMMANKKDDEIEVGKEGDTEINGSAASDEVEHVTEDPMPKAVPADAGEPSTSAAPAGKVALPPSPSAFDGPRPIEIAFCFDTTGSMSTCIEVVKESVKTIIQRLFMDIPSLKIAVMAHGDYCDADVFYLYKLVDFTNDVNALCTFVNDVEGTGGGDWEECYELMLQKARDELSWSSQTQKSLVMIGDAIPHLPDYLLPDYVSANSVSTYKLPASPGQPIQLHWMTEMDRLHQQLGVHIYAVQCQNNKDATPFWQHLAEATSGRHLQLDQFTTIIDTIMAICYREQGPELFEAYEREVRLREGPGIRQELDRLFDTLRDSDTAPVVDHGVKPGTSGTAATRRPKGAAKTPIDRTVGVAKVVKRRPKAAAKTPTGKTLGAAKVKKGARVADTGTATKTKKKKVPTATLR